MDKDTRDSLRKTVEECRELLEESVSGVLEGEFGVHSSGTVEPEEALGGLSEEDRECRGRILGSLNHIEAAGFDPDDAVEQLIREVAFTHLNRLCAYKMMEARGLVREAVTSGLKSQGFMFYLADHPEDEKRWSGGRQDVAYRHYLHWLAETFSEQIPALFSPNDPANRLFPPQRVLDQVLELINDEELAGIWDEDETIGWVYQYFTPKSQRKKARDESSAPRNSYELAFRNQFYTPRYVVEFLTDNTLGRTWYEMRAGRTELTEQCTYLVHRPDEVFLSQRVRKEAEEDPDAAFLLGETDELAPFEAPHEKFQLDSENPLASEYQRDEAGRRLRQFAHYVRPFAWVSDPREEEWTELLQSLQDGQPDDPVAGKTQDLWDLLLAIARNDRFCEGSFSKRGLPLTRIANEIRRRLLRSRDEDTEHEDVLKTPHLVIEREARDPREIKILDPACGSGHFLLYCFDLLQTIYEEAWRDGTPAGTVTGNTLRDDYETVEDLRRAVPELILRHNLHGIDIDLRAVQIAALALWLRAQRAYQRMGLSAGERPEITRSNIVCAEPMPGEQEMLEEFLETLSPPLLRDLVRQVWDKMELADEAGSLLKIEQHIRGAIERALKAWEKRPRAEQIRLFEGLDEAGEPKLKQVEVDLTAIRDEIFFETAEQRILMAVEDYAEKTQNGKEYQRRLFAEDSAVGFRFAEVLQKDFDVVLMNPPFGAASEPSKDYVDDTYSRTKNDVYAAFVERALELLVQNGMVGAITSRTGFFLTTFQKWREEILLDEAEPFVFADLGYGVLDTAMVETAAYCLRKRVEQEFVVLPG